MKIDRTIKYILSSEFLFTLLPIVILIIVRSYNQDCKAIFYNTEWSIIAIILFGQSIVKFSSGVSNSRAIFRWQFVALIISIIIIFGMIPASVTLVLILSCNTLNFGIYFTQFIIFILSCISFFIVGAIGQTMLEEK